MEFMRLTSPEGFERPTFGPDDCRFVRLNPGWAATLSTSHPSDTLRRANSFANIRFASFDCPYAPQAL